MEKEEKFTYWKEQEMWLGYLDEFPDYWTESESIDELEDNLKEISEFLSSQLTEQL